MPDHTQVLVIGAGTFEIEVATKRIPATASIRSFYEARNERVRL